MLKNMDPPLGFGNKCPNRLAYKKLIRMNMPLDAEGKVGFTTTLFALIRENLNIKMRTGESEDLNLSSCVIHVSTPSLSRRNGPSGLRTATHDQPHLAAAGEEAAGPAGAPQGRAERGQADGGQDLRRPAHPRVLAEHQVRPDRVGPAGKWAGMRFGRDGFLFSFFVSVF